jgi:hypothetical protein
MRFLNSLILFTLLVVANLGYAGECDVSVSLCDRAVTLEKMEATAFSYVDVNLSAANLDTLNATPITILAAPGSGKATEVQGGFCFVDFVATRLELGSGTLDFKYTDGSGASVMTSVPNATVELNSDTYYRSIASAVVPVPNAAIVASASADVTSGDSIINCRIYYRTVVISTI